MRCIAELVLKIFRSLSFALTSLDVCSTISRNAVPFDVSCTTSRRAVSLGCTVWMYAKLFHEKLCHLMLCCINWPNTVQFLLGLPHLTPRWTVSPDSVSFHAQLFHLSLYQFLLCSSILCNAIPFDITLAQVKLCCAASLFVLWEV